jgi:hypothetical protein
MMEKPTFWRNIAPFFRVKSKPSKKPAEAGGKLRNIGLPQYLVALQPTALYSS